MSSFKLSDRNKESETKRERNREKQRKREKQRDQHSSFTHKKKRADPARQFELVREHISKIRQKLCWMDSHIKIYVERNLGFEAEHHARDLGSLPGVVFHQVRCVCIYICSLINKINLKAGRNLVFVHVRENRGEVHPWLALRRKAGQPREPLRRQVLLLGGNSSSMVERSDESCRMDGRRLVWHLHGLRGLVSLLDLLRSG